MCHTEKESKQSKNGFFKKRNVDLFLMSKKSRGRQPRVTRERSVSGAQVSSTFLLCRKRHPFPRSLPGPKRLLGVQSFNKDPSKQEGVGGEKRHGPSPAVAHMASAYVPLARVLLREPDKYGFYFGVPSSWLLIRGSVPAEEGGK